MAAHRLLDLLTCAEIRSVVLPSLAPYKRMLQVQTLHRVDRKADLIYKQRHGIA